MHLKVDRLPLPLDELVRLGHLALDLDPGAPRAALEEPAGAASPRRAPTGARNVLARVGPPLGVARARGRRRAALAEGERAQGRRRERRGLARDKDDGDDPALVELEEALLAERHLEVVAARGLERADAGREDRRRAGRREARVEDERRRRAHGAAGREVHARDAREAAGERDREGEGERALELVGLVRRVAGEDAAVRGAERRGRPQVVAVLEEVDLVRDRVPTRGVGLLGEGAHHALEAHADVRDGLGVAQDEGEGAREGDVAVGLLLDEDDVVLAAGVEVEAELARLGGEDVAAFGREVGREARVDWSAARVAGQLVVVVGGRGWRSSSGKLWWVAPVENGVDEGPAD